MKHLICIIAVFFAFACKSTGETEPTSEPAQTAEQAAPTDPTAPEEEPVEPEEQPSEPESQPADDGEKCCRGIGFDEVKAFPFSFTVSKKSATLGKIAIDAKHAVTFAPAEGANTEQVAEIQGLVDAANKEDTVSYKYTNRTADRHCKCGGAAQKNTPQYPGAFKHSLYSEYFDVSD